jgi:hypothetical protein
VAFFVTTTLPPKLLIDWVFLWIYFLKEIIISIDDKAANEPDRPYTECHII